MNVNEPKRYSFNPERALILLIKVFVPGILLVGGLVLLALKIAGWSIVFGLPMVIFGVVFLIYTYDDICSRRERY